MSTDLEWAWLAGLFEGEGTICDDGKTKVVVRVTMTDRDVVEHLNRLVPSPRGLHVKTRQPTNTMPQYVWQLARKADVERFLTAIHPYMGTRRSARIDRALARLKEGRRCRV